MYIVKLSDTVWLNLSKVARVERRGNGTMRVYLSAKRDGPLDFTGDTAAMLERVLDSQSYGYTDTIPS